MSLKQYTPCDEVDPLTGLHYCPYADSSDYVNCEYWCGVDEPEDNDEPEYYREDE